MDTSILTAPVLTTIALGALLLSIASTLLGGSKATNLPPGDVSYFSSFLSPSAIIPTFQKLAEDPRPVFRFMLFGKNMAIVNDAEVARSLASKDGDIITSTWPSTMKELLGAESFSNTHGPYHRQVRKLLAQGFSSQAIESYLPSIRKLVERRLAAWAKEDSVKMSDQARLLAFEVIAVVVAGCQMDEDELLRLAHQFDIFAKGLFLMSHIDLPWTAFGKAKQARKVLVAALEEQLRHAASAKGADSQLLQQDGEEGDSKHGSLMAKLAVGTDENGKPLSRKALQDIGISLLFTGHETTATSLGLLLMLLLDRPDVWERLREEQHQVVAAQGDAITGEAIREMKYLDAVLKEVWRWYPLVGSAPRLMLRDAEVGGFTVPKGWQVILNFGTMIRADGAARWGPGEGMGQEDFNPDRWLGAQGGGVGVLPGSNAFVFGMGGRTCLGAPLAWAEIKVVVAVLARKYQVVNVLDHPPAWTKIPVTWEGSLPLRIVPLEA